MSVQTGAQLRVRQLANLAMSSESPILVNFTLAKYGTLDVCASMSRSLQTTFSSMRARDRKIVVTTGATEKESPFDRLVCQRTPLPNGLGWVVALYKSSNILDEWEIVDGKTGERIGHNEKDNLLKEFVADPQRFWDNAEKMARMEELDPEFREGALLFFKPRKG